MFWKRLLCYCIIVLLGVVNVVIARSPDLRRNIVAHKSAQQRRHVDRIRLSPYYCSRNPGSCVILCRHPLMVSCMDQSAAPLQATLTQPAKAPPARRPSRAEQQETETNISGSTHTPPYYSRRNPGSSVFLCRHPLMVACGDQSAAPLQATLSQTAKAPSARRLSRAEQRRSVAVGAPQHLEGAPTAEITPMSHQPILR